MSVNSRLKSTKIISQRKAFYSQRITESSCVRKETVDIEILVTSRNSDRKIMQSIRMSQFPSRIRKCNQLNQFRWTSTQVLPIKKTYAGYISTMSQEFKRSSKWSLTTWRCSIKQWKSHKFLLTSVNCKN